MVKVDTFHIIGSGISGLVTAYELAKTGKNVRIYEKMTVPGGLARTESHDGISYDSGPHLFHTNNESIKNYWLDLINHEVSEPSLYGANYKNGRIYEYPFSYQSLEDQFSNEQNKIIKKELNDRNLENLNLSKNYSEYVKNLAGKYLSEMFFTKYPKKLWGIPPDKLSAKFAPRRIEIRKEHRPFHSGDGKWAGVLKNGCGALAIEIEKKLNNLGVYIEFEKELSDIILLKEESVNNSILKLTFNKNTEINLGQSDIVISTIPITNIAKFFNIKNNLWYRSIKIICFLSSEKITLPSNYDWLYFDDEEIPFHRITLQDSFSKNGRPEGYSIISCEVAYSEGDEVDSEADQTLIQRSLESLIEKKIVNQESIIDHHMIDAKNVYPGIFVGYEEELNRVKAKLDNINNLYLHGAPAEYEYSDLQVLTAKSIDLASVLSKKSIASTNNLTKSNKISPSRTFKINESTIGQDEYPFIISEIGLNHNGDISIAKKLIDQSLEAGASAAKLQSYKRGRISSKVRTSRYYEDLVDTQESLSSLLDKIRLSKENTEELFKYARDKNFTLFSTPFDIESLELLEQVNCPAYKISSMDVVNIPLIKEVASTGKPLIISTGMSDLSDIELALETVLNEKNDQVALLHCISSYPCPAASANLGMIKKIENTFNCITGYSDHTTGIDVSLGAISLGASIIEKHFTIDRNMDGPDHNFSLLKDELTNLVRSSKRIKEATIDHGFGVLPSEINTAQNLRRSIFYNKELKKDHIITIKDIEVKSPGIGIHPKFFDMIIGKKLIKEVEEDFPVQWEDIS